MQKTLVPGSQVCFLTIFCQNHLAVRDREKGLRGQMVMMECGKHLNTFPHLRSTADQCFTIPMIFIKIFKKVAIFCISLTQREKF